MDYLGIGITSPSGSEAGDQPTEATRGDTDMNITTQAGTRTWSKPTDVPGTQPFQRSRGAQSPIISGRGIIVSKYWQLFDPRSGKTGLNPCA
ncbi:hypothetical protein DPMN_120978 [Dreissena polymorpha]|uniref:Uncharacterized protein n=1 Tax=Dreissena polymorpha TaxID=45954 RepID=A0A9D4JQP2_DREPO|nr:hypothetical protein DPMN_120978 [Dreissena polymorpha]